MSPIFPNSKRVILTNANTGIRKVSPGVNTSRDSKTVIVENNHESCQKDSKNKEDNPFDQEMMKPKGINIFQSDFVKSEYGSGHDQSRQIESRVESVDLKLPGKSRYIKYSNQNEKIKNVLKNNRIDE
jgi:hypothetical protein